MRDEKNEAVRVRDKLFVWFLRLRVINSWRCMVDPCVWFCKFMLNQKQDHKVAT